MSTHNVCFCGEIRKLSVDFAWKKTLSGAMYNNNNDLQCQRDYISGML